MNPILMRILANRPFGSDYGKSGVKALWSLFSCGFPDPVVRHGCHCTLLLRGRQSSLGMGQGLVLVIHVGTAGGLSGHAHFRQVFPYCSDHIPRIGSGMSDVADIPKPLVGKGLSSLTMNRSNLTLAAIPVRTRPLTVSGMTGESA